MLLRALGTYPVGNGLPFVLQAFRAFFLVRTPSAHVDDVFWAFFQVGSECLGFPTVSSHSGKETVSVTFVSSELAPFRRMQVARSSSFHCSALTLARRGN